MFSALNYILNGNNCSVILFMAREVKFVSLYAVHYTFMSMYI
ncbi:hypothetical protein RchiOBHm_Chr1g0323001 [Rosa chinensis]|uniref:Uncharacterized protein n=1 Tax=Rosa chinensis TaxID=74649 RepID=A0A2P6S9G9_ROSCH|nr:hypothetical protein RchiOBHm_Chr1g0323001 [Rosa chinensis]